METLGVRKAKPFRLSYRLLFPALTLSKSFKTKTRPPESFANFTAHTLRSLENETQKCPIGTKLINCKLNIPV